MPRRRGQPDSLGRAGRERDLETVRLVNHALQQDPVRAAGARRGAARLPLVRSRSVPVQVDVATLRKLAAVRGLVTDPLRARVWPKLLGADDSGLATTLRFVRHAADAHRDSTTVQCDVDRSLWHFTADWSEERRALKRAALQRVLNGATLRSTESLTRSLSKR